MTLAQGFALWIVLIVIGAVIDQRRRSKPVSKFSGGLDVADRIDRLMKNTDQDFAHMGEPRLNNRPAHRVGGQKVIRP
jgi:hypothetical protein